MRKSPYPRYVEVNPNAAYAGSADALWTWQREAGLSDKALARLAGCSPNTVKAARQRRELFGLKTLYRLREALPESWWAMVIGTHTDEQQRELEARAVALETRLQALRADIARAREAK